jgi:hypothetical protein
MSRSLENIRVVDLSHVLAAPTCTMFLADLGAEVIHVEPLHGDDAREFGPFADSGGKNNSGYFISLNRNKKSLALDLKQEKGKKILTDLIKISDVVVENFRPTTMRKLGFGWEELQRINPKIIYASISGFGQDSLPGYDSRPSYDMVAQGYSGLMSITGPEGGPPCRVGSSVGDIFAPVKNRPGTAFRRSHDRRAFHRAGERRCALHDQRRGPRPSRQRPSIDRPLPILSDKGRFPYDHCTGKRQPVGKLLQADWPGGFEPSPQVRH